MSTSNCCNCAAEADALSKYESLYPKSFIECIREGCTWLANHNNITYQTSILVRTDSTIYSKSGSSIIKLGLIDSDKPTTGLTEYDVLSVTEAKDTVNGSTIYNVKCSYKTPMGINLTLIPINYVDPKKEDTNRCYSVAEVNALIAGLEDKINASKTDTSSDIIGQTIDKYLNIKLADYTLTSYLEQQISVLNNKIANMSVGGGVDLSEYAKTTEVDTKIQTAIADIPAADLTDYATKSFVTEKIAESATGGTISLDGYAKTEEVKTLLGGYTTSNQVDTKIATAVAAIPATDLSNYATTASLSDYVTTANLTTQLASKANIVDLDTKANSSDVYTKTETDNALDQTKENAMQYATVTITKSLTTKADISTTYTKQEVDDLISEIKTQIDTLSSNNIDADDMYAAVVTL